MINFHNLEKAFAAKSDAELRNDYLLFKIIGNQWLTKAAPSLTGFALKFRLPVKRIIKATLFKHFCGGEYIEECNKTVAKLHQYKVGSILDYSAEGEEKEEKFDFTEKEIIATILHAKGDPAIPFCVFKPTGVARLALLEKVSSGKTLVAGEAEEFNRVINRIKNICRTAAENNVRIFVDAEETWIQKAIDDLVTQMMAEYNKQQPIVYNTIQLYRTDRLDFLKQAYEHALRNNYWLGIKLVRGAYMEKERDRAKQLGYPSPIHATKSGSDRDFDAALRFCVKHVDRVAICAGTHNEHSSMLLVQLMKEKNIPANDPKIYFSQLLGMSDHISYNLASAGYNVAKYVPYGPVATVLPYLIRRAQENTSIAGQMGRELSLIVEEMKRRKKG
ncbi:MAG TPA: proline dehydrogenase family protein [Bacteroidia bacterium]|nr:proline dehydrogenase family protein [Bacteroidia bacterium]